MDTEFVQFLGFSLRSCREVCTAAELAVRFGYVKADAARTVTEAAEEVTKMLYALMHKLGGK